MTGTRTFRVAAALSLMMFLAGAGCSRRRDQVRLAYPPMMGSLPVFIAQDQQLFEKRGLQVRTVPFSSSNDMVSALVAGQVDLLPAVSLVPLIHLEIQQPGKFRVFSHSHMRRDNSTYRIVVKSASPLAGLKDLEGRKVGVFPGTSATRLVSAFLKLKQVDPEKVTFIQLPSSAQVSSLEAGAIDALFAYDPLLLMGEPAHYRALSNSIYAELSEPCPLGASVIARDFERAHPQAAARAAGAIQDAIAYMGAHPQEVRPLLPRFTKMTAEVASRVNVADVTLTNEVDPAALQRFIDLLYQIGEIPERIDANRLIAPTR